MMSSNANPSIDPADEDSLIGTLKFAFSKMMQDVNGMLPARVVAFDRATNRASVEILIAVLTTEGTQVPRAQLASVPVFTLGGGGFMINFNLLPGDLGWIKANDRDISLFLQSYGNVKPNTLRKNNFSDSVFFPDVMRNYTINGEDDDNLVLQNLDGTIRISLFDDKIKMTAQADSGAAQTYVEITSDETTIYAQDVTGAINSNMVVSPTGITMLLNAGTGTLAVTGNITATGTIIP